MGILVLALGVAMGTVLASAGLVPVSQFLARTDPVALGGLPSDTSELIGEDSRGDH